MTEADEPLTAEDVYRLMSTQNDRILEHGEALAQLVELSIKAASKDKPKYAGHVKLPTFSGKPNEDVKEFLVNYTRATTCHGWNDVRQAQALLLHLKDAVITWFNAQSGLANTVYGTQAVLWSFADRQRTRGGRGLPQRQPRLRRLWRRRLLPKRRWRRPLLRDGGESLSYDTWYDTVERTG